MKNGTILKQSFDSTVMRHNLCRNEDFETIEQCVNIADNYAVEFANWCKKEYELEDTPYHNKWRDVDGRYISTEELLVKFKREVYSEHNVE